MLDRLMAGSVRPATAVGWKSAVRPGAIGWLALALVLLVAVVVADRGSLSQFAAQFGSLDLRWAGVGLVLMAGVDFAKALRWQVLYGQLRPSYRRVLQAQVVGQAANTLVPLRLGEVLRVSWAAPTPSGVARGTAGLVLTKAVDAVVLAGLIAWVFGGSLLAQAQLMPVVGLGLLVAIGLGLAQRYRHIGGGGLGAMRPLLAAAARYARELHAGTLAVVVATSAFAWIVGGAANLAVLAAVGGAPIDRRGRAHPGQRLRGRAVSGAAGWPAGRIEGAVAAALTAGGMDLPMGVAVAVVLHALQLIEMGLLVLAATRWRPRGERTKPPADSASTCRQPQTDAALPRTVQDHRHRGRVGRALRQIERELAYQTPVSRVTAELARRQRSSHPVWEKGTPTHPARARKHYQGDRRAASDCPHGLAEARGPSCCTCHRSRASDFDLMASGCLRDLALLQLSSERTVCVPGQVPLQ